jgi:CheY-like chemotaxis protein
MFGKKYYSAVLNDDLGTSAGLTEIRRQDALLKTGALQNAILDSANFSSNTMLHDIKKGLEAGFLRYLTKPIKVSEFMDVLDFALEYSEMRLASIVETEQTS